MKMFKLMGKRGFAVFTALALCAGLVVPSFAATIMDLQYAINGETGKYKEDAFTITEGENGRTIQFNESVVRDVVNGDATGDIKFGKVTGQNITLDLNGYDIDANGTGSALYVNNGVNLTIKDSTATYDEDGNQTYAGDGKITGGATSGIRVDGGSVTLESGAITGNTTSAPSAGGGGVYVTNGSFTMTGGEITDNTAKYSGGGVGVSGSDSSFTMTGGVISGNTAENSAGNIAGNGGGGGGGVWIKGGASFEMSGGEITGNEVKGDSGNGGGVAIHQGTFTMTDGTIANNDSARGTGVLINAGSNGGGDATFTMTGGYTSGKEDTSCIYLEETAGKDATFELRNDAVMDGSIRLGEGTQVITSNVTQPGGDHKYTGFDVVDENGKKTDSIESAQTETEDGYAVDEDTLLDVKYDHVYTGPLADNGNGTHSHSCQFCDNRDPNHADGHSWDEGVVKESSCTSEMTIYTCTGCGATKVEADTSANNHVWETRTLAQPTCTKAGLKAQICTECGATKDEEPIPALNHQEDGVDAASEKWGKNESSHWHTCTLCGEAVFANGAHNWNDGEVTAEATAEADGEMTYTCEDCHATKTESIPFVAPEPETPDPDEGEDPDIVIDDPDVPLASLPDEVEIEDPEVPLAGLLTRADVIGYLWEKSGSPNAELSTFEDVPADHEWAVAIGWAQDVGIAVADVDGNFRPDDLILRSVEDIELSPEGEFEQFLNRYAVYAGIKLGKDELFFKLDGDPDDIIMGEDAQIIFDEFFSRLELALAQAA